MLARPKFRQWVSAETAADFVEASKILPSSNEVGANCTHSCYNC